jgi:hypothetical protein
MIIVDCVRAWRSPFNPEGVTAECADLLRSYRVNEVTGDKYAGEWPREQFRKRGVAYRIAEHDRSALYLMLLPVIQAAGVEIPDQPDLLRELRGLERRRGPSGKDRVDHRPGSHDDRANALAGLVSLLPARRELAPVLPDYMSGSALSADDDGRDANDHAAVLDSGGGLSDYARREKRARRFLPDGW